VNPSVTYVSCEGVGSMLACSRLLAPWLGVRELRTDLCEDPIAAFNAPLLSASTVRAFPRQLRFVATLNRMGGLNHLSHHLGRYGLFL
jgi:hypothetical protein